MRPCIQMAMMRSEKTHPTVSLAHQKKHLTIHQASSIKKKRLKNKSTINVDEETN